MLRATCRFNDRTRINIPVVKVNKKTVLVQILKKNGWGVPVPNIVKRHIDKHNVRIEVDHAH